MSSSELACFVIHPGTGEILRRQVCSPPSFEAMQAAGEELRPVLDGISDDTHFWDYLAREWRAYPHRPGPWAEFDFMARQWIDPRTPADHQAELFAAREAIRRRRDQAIDTGIVVAGVPLHTDERSRSNIMGAALSAMLDPDYSVAWKGADGVFVTLTAEQVIAVAQAIRAHVQACFDREAALLADLDAGQAYDLDHGWPEQEAP